MKAIFLIIIVATGFLFSCNKNENDKSGNSCPAIAASSVPQVVKDSFAAKYPSDSVRTRYNKDSVAFCAFFISSGIEKMAQFANNGTFIRAEVETDTEQQGQHEDSTGVKPQGCECEIDIKGD